MSSNDVDAEKLRQIVDLYARDGYVAQVQNFGETADELRITAIDRNGTHVPNFWAKQEELDALRRLGILEPEEWETKNEECKAIRKYKLTALGAKFARESDREKLGYFAAAGYKAHANREVTWEQEELE
jgi:hypothetical protein